MVINKNCRRVYVLCGSKGFLLARLVQAKAAQRLRQVQPQQTQRRFRVIHKRLTPVVAHVVVVAVVRKRFSNTAQRRCFNFNQIDGQVTVSGNLAIFSLAGCDNAKAPT
jgi:hypothetical protein